KHQGCGSNRGISASSGVREPEALHGTSIMADRSSIGRRSTSDPPVFIPNSCARLRLNRLLRSSSADANRVVVGLTDKDGSAESNGNAARATGRGPLCVASRRDSYGSLFHSRIPLKSDIPRTACRFFPKLFALYRLTPRSQRMMIRLKGTPSSHNRIRTIAI